MVQKYQSPVRVYKYPFELVMAVSCRCLFLVIDCSPVGYLHEGCLRRLPRDHRYAPFVSQMIVAHVLRRPCNESLALRRQC